MGLIENVKRALLAKRALDRLKEAQMKGTLKTALVGVGGAILTAFVAAVDAECPGLWAKWPVILTGAATAGIGLWLRKPSDKPVIEAAAAKGITHESIK